MFSKFIRTSSLIMIIAFGACANVQASEIPSVSAEAYILIDSSSGRILGSKDADKKLPMASTTKIMTSILAIDSIADLDEEIKIPAACTNIEGSSIYLKPDQEVSIRDLLYGTMLRSGNDAALSLAYAAGNGDSDSFIAMMNEKAKELGAFNTHFVNPNGLHDKDHYTTAYDLALISRYAMQNDTFRQVASAKTFKAESLESVLYNKNKVVHQYDGGSGVKIGYTQNAGRCLVASANRDGSEYIAVFLNDYSWFTDAYALFDWAFDNYKTYEIIGEGQYLTDAGRKTKLFAEDGFRCALKEDEISDIHVGIAKNKGRESKYSYKVYLGSDLLIEGRVREE